MTTSDLHDSLLKTLIEISTIDYSKREKSIYTVQTDIVN